MQGANVIYFQKSLSDKRNKQDYAVLLIYFCLFSCSNNLFAVIVAAFRAYMMGHLRFVALGASNVARSLQLPISTALVAAGLGHFSLWYCHLVSPPEQSDLLFSEIHT